MFASLTLSKPAADADPHLTPAQRERKRKREGVDPLQSLTLRAGQLVVGVDPGETSIVTVVTRSGKGVRTTRKQTRSYSYEQYVRETGQQATRRQLNAMRRRRGLAGDSEGDGCVTAAELESRIPTPKTACVQQARQHVREMSKVALRLEGFYARRTHRTRRQRSYTLHQRALDGICKAVTGGDYSVGVAYGDGNFKGLCRHKVPAPTKRVFRALEQRTAAAGGFCVKVPEHRTSCVCSLCKAPVKLEKRTVWDGQRRRTAHAVLTCSNMACQACWWNRDVNGARNIRDNLFYVLRGVPRPPEATVFERGHPWEDETAAGPKPWTSMRKSTHRYDGGAWRRRTNPADGAAG